MVYSAMTRARDELIMTYVNEPSVFKETIADEIDSLPTSDGMPLIEFLAKLG